MCDLRVSLLQCFFSSPSLCSLSFFWHNTRRKFLFVDFNTTEQYAHKLSKYGDKQNFIKMTAFHVVIFAITWNKVNVQNILFTQCNLIYNIINLEYMNWLLSIILHFFFRSGFLTCDIKMLMKYFIFRSNEKGKRKFKLIMAVQMKMHMCSFCLDSSSLKFIQKFH